MAILGRQRSTSGHPSMVALSATFSCSSGTRLATSTQVAHSHSEKLRSHHYSQLLKLSLFPRASPKPVQPSLTSHAIPTIAVFLHSVSQRSFELDCSGREISHHGLNQSNGIPTVRVRSRWVGSSPPSSSCPMSYRLYQLIPYNTVPFNMKLSKFLLFPAYFSILSFAISYAVCCTR